MKKTIAILLAAMLLTMGGCFKPAQEPAASKEAVEQPAQEETTESKEEVKAEEPKTSTAVAKQFTQVQGDGETVYFVAGGLFEYKPKTGETKTLYMPASNNPLEYAVYFFFVTDDAVYFLTGFGMSRYDRTSGKVEKAFDPEGGVENLQLLGNQLIVSTYEDDAEDENLGSKIEHTAYDLSNNYQEIPLEQIEGTWMSMDYSRAGHPTMSKHDGEKTEKIEETYHYGWNGTQLYYSSDSAGKQIYQYDLVTGEKTSFAKQETFIQHVSVDENWVYTWRDLEGQKEECYRLDRKTGEKEMLPDEPFSGRMALMQFGDYLYGFGGATSEEDYMVCMGPDGEVNPVNWEEVPLMDQEALMGDD